MFVCCGCCVLSGRGLCDGLITRPEESYRLWRVVMCDQETSWMSRLKPATGLWKYNHNGLLRQENKQTTIDDNHGTRNESSHSNTEVFIESAFTCPSLSCPCPCTETYGGSKGIAPFILNLSAMWKWVVNITLWPLCPEKEPQYSLNRRVNRTQSQSERLRKERNLLSLLVFEPQIVQPVTKFFFLVRLKKIPTDFIETAIENFAKIPPAWAEIFLFDGRTDEQIWQSW
jgi:hypothetical protein